MSLYRLQKFADGDGDPIDASDARAILEEFGRLRKESYNLGLDTAISVAREMCDYEMRMTGFQQTLISGLESSKI